MAKAFSLRPYLTREVPRFLYPSHQITRGTRVFLLCPKLKARVAVVGMLRENGRCPNLKLPPAGLNAPDVSLQPTKSQRQGINPHMIPQRLLEGWAKGNLIFMCMTHP